MADEKERKVESSACGCGGGGCCNRRRGWIWAILVLAIAGVLIAKHAGRTSHPDAAAPTQSLSTAVEAPGPTNALPRLVDLGSRQCAACKMMTPVLEELKRTYAGALEVRFIDVWEQPDEARPYAIKLIPTQIFYDATGRERFRHEGFLGRDDILAKWKELGVELKGSEPPE